MALHPAEKLYVVKTESALAVVRGCRLCKFYLFRHKGGRGRGTGLREGNKQRGAMIQHIKEAHPTEYLSAMDASRVRVE